MRSLNGATFITLTFFFPHSILSVFELCVFLRHTPMFQGHDGLCIALVVFIFFITKGLLVPFQLVEFWRHQGQKMVNWSLDRHFQVKLYSQLCGVTQLGRPLEDTPCVVAAGQTWPIKAALCSDWWRRLWLLAPLGEGSGWRYSKRLSSGQSLLWTSSVSDLDKLSLWSGQSLIWTSSVSDLDKLEKGQFELLK